MDKGEETRSELIITRGDSAELLELEEEGFHKMAFLVEPPIDEPRVGVVRLGRDAEIRVVVGDKLAKLPLAVSPVSKDRGSFQVNLAEQFFSDSDVTGVASGQHDLNRIAQGIHNSVNLGASATSTDANALITWVFAQTESGFWLGGSKASAGFESPLSRHRRLPCVP